MGKQVIKEFLKTWNDQDKDKYVRDLCNSICTYVKTDNKNELLDNFLVDAAEIKNEINQIFVEKIDSIILKNAYMQPGKSKGENLAKQVEVKWKDNMKKIMYLSHLNMLYEMYKQEMLLKEEQKKYVRASVDFPKLFKIAAEISQQRRMLIDKLKEQFSLSDEEYNFMIAKYKMYFNFRKDKNGQIIQISLSPRGKNYLRYICDTE